MRISRYGWSPEKGTSTGVRPTSDGNGKVISNKFKSFWSHIVNRHSNLDDPFSKVCTWWHCPYEMDWSCYKRANHSFNNCKFLDFSCIDFLHQKSYSSSKMVYFSLYSFYRAHSVGDGEEGLERWQLKEGYHAGITMCPNGLPGRVSLSSTYLHPRLLPVKIYMGIYCR